MEERSIELTAKGHSVGESIDMVIKSEGTPVIGEPFVISILFPGIEEGSLDISIDKINGFQDGASNLEAPGSVEDPFRITIVPTGRPGPSLLWVSLKGEVYGATLSLQETDIDVKPPQMEVSLVNEVIKSTGNRRILVPLKLKMGGNERFKGEVVMAILDGSDRTLARSDPIQVNFKGSRTVEMGSDLPSVEPGIYSFLVTSRDRNGKSRRYIRDALRITGPGPDRQEEPQRTEPAEDPGSVSSLFMKFDPRDAAPGGEVQLHLDIKRSEDETGPLGVVLLFGRRKILETTIPEGSSNLRVPVKVPDDIAPGSITAIVKVLKDKELVLREVVSRALSINASSRLNVVLATPGDLDDGGQDEFSGFLLPEERIISRRDIGDITLMTLSTGRHLYTSGGSVVLGPDWDIKDTDEAFDRILGLEISETLLETSLVRMLKRDLDHNGRSNLLSLSRKGRIDLKIDPWETDDTVLEGPYQGLMTGSLLSRHGDEKSDIMSIAKVKGIQKDPVPSIVNDINGIFSISGIDGDIKAHYELIIKEFRNRKGGPGREEILRAHHLALKNARSSLEMISEEGGNLTGAKQFLFHAIAASLVRIEALTSWSDPAIGSWDDLRIERQRMMKREISDLFDLLDSTVSISRSLRKRLMSYRTNMELRRTLASLSRARIVTGGGDIGGSGGSIWKGKLVIDLGKKGIEKQLVMGIRLPDLSWNLASPPSQRDGPLFIVPKWGTDSLGRQELELEVVPPSTVSSAPKAILYIAPRTTRMEVEE